MKGKKNGNEMVEGFRRQVVERLLADMEEGGLDWVRPWSRPPLPTNPLGRQSRYRGCNVVHLLGAAVSRGLSDPRWSTWKQVRAKGWHVRKGAKSAPVEFWKLVGFDKEGVDADDNEAVEHVRYPKLVGYYRVFNWSEVEGAPAYEAPAPLGDSGQFEIADQVISRWRDRQGCGMVEGAPKACYVPAADTVEVPFRGLFSASGAFLRTLLHEVSHSTGHEKRLARDGIVKFGTWGDEGYAFEELVAELGSMFSAGGLGCSLGAAEGRFYENHLAYLKSWMSALEEDPDGLFRAAAQAQKAADLIVGTCEADADGTEADMAEGEAA